MDRPIDGVDVGEEEFRPRSELAAGNEILQGSPIRGV